MSIHVAAREPTPGHAAEHLAVLYRDDASLVRVVAKWLAPTLATGGGALAIVTPEHADAVRLALRDLGVDPGPAEDEGRLLVVDAEWLMARFILDRAPEGGMFHALLDGLLARLRAATPGREVRAWGEMVGLLAHRGQRANARILEQMWEEAIERHGLSLLCSYCTRDLDPRVEALLATEVAASHRRILDP